MTVEEREICSYLKSWPGQFISGREISRRACGKRRYREDPGWAGEVLPRMVDKGILETDSTGHYRLLPEHLDKKKRAKKWLAPQVKHILRNSEKNFGEVIEINEDELEK
jgi:hypothetical protein